MVREETGSLPLLRTVVVELLCFFLDLLYLSMIYVPSFSIHIRFEWGVVLETVYGLASGNLSSLTGSFLSLSFTS